MQKSLVVAMLVISLGSTAVQGQAQNSGGWPMGRSACAMYFEARAAWMHGLDGQPETVGMMRRYADILWHAVPRDWGMRTGLGSDDIETSRNEGVIHFLTKWADEGYGDQQRPICPEDADCAHCMGVLQATVTAQN